jgi:hypothetical protein
MVDTLMQNVCRIGVIVQAFLPMPVFVGIRCENTTKQQKRGLADLASFVTSISVWQNTYQQP